MSQRGFLDIRLYLGIPIQGIPLDPFRAGKKHAEPKFAFFSLFQRINWANGEWRKLFN